MITVVYHSPLVPFVRVGRERWTRRAKRYMACKDAVADAIREQAGVVGDVMRAAGWRVDIDIDRRRADGDLDNLLKLWMDAAQGILWTDDKQVLDVRARVRRKAKADRTTMQAEVIT